MQYANPYLAQNSSPFGWQGGNAYPPQYHQPNIKVDGLNEAMNRLLMTHPANQLVPGFVSDPIFDINGRQFYTLSIEADGHRNFETFDFSKHVEQQPVQQDYVTRAEFQGLIDKVNGIIGGNDGIHGPVQAATTDQAQPAV